MIDVSNLHPDHILLSDAWFAARAGVIGGPPGGAYIGGPDTVHQLASDYVAAAAGLRWAAQYALNMVTGREKSHKADAVWEAVAKAFEAKARTLEGRIMPKDQPK